MKKFKVRWTFFEEALGSLPANESIYSEYIGSKAEDAKTLEEEVKDLGVDETIDSKMTIFPKLADGTPFVYDYQIRGFFKEMCGINKKIPGTASSKITAHKKLIDDYVFVAPRKIPLTMNGLKMDVCERPLRADTMQGPRTALAMSESVPEGTTVEFTVTLMLDKAPEKKGKEAVDYTDALIEWLEYGQFKGYGQWRNSGKGRLLYELYDSDGKLIKSNVE